MQRRDSCYTGRGKEKGHMDVAKDDMQRVGVTKENATDTVRWRQPKGEEVKSLCAISYTFGHHQSLDNIKMLC